MNDLYPDAEDPLPPNMPEHRGKQVNIHVLVYSDHAENRVTHYSHTGMMTFIKSGPIQFLSKK